MNAVQSISTDDTHAQTGSEISPDERAPWWSLLHKPDSRAVHPTSTASRWSTPTKLGHSGAVITGLLMVDRRGRLIEPSAMRGAHWNDVFGSDTWPAALAQSAVTQGAFTGRVDQGQPQRQAERRSELSSPVSSDADRALLDREQWVDLAPDIRRCLRIRLFSRNDHYLAWIDDITERKHVERRLRYAAEHDSLSGLLNPRGFHQRIQEKIAQADWRPVFLIYMDLDDFKQINDFFGHAAGDQLLRQIALRIRHHIRSEDLAARLGGDEFALLMVDGDAARVLAVVERLRDALRERPYPWQGHLFNVGVSVGIIRLDSQISPADALAAADAACQLSKRSPVDRSLSLTESRDVLAGRCREMAMALRWRGQQFEKDLSCDMQAIVALDSSNLPIGFECLLRMRDPGGDLRLPDQFLPVARRHGLVTRFDQWMLESTLAWLDQYRHKLPQLRFCSINLSGASLNDQHFMDRVCSLASRYPDAVRQLCFEIGDAADSARRGLPRNFMEQCRRQGIQVALDDYGGPRRTLPNLLDLPVDFIKLSPHLTASALTD
jgi:diguanylate cyclase (GGDEF)-like protein